MANKHKVTSRTRARKRAIDVIYEAQMQGMRRDGRVLNDLLMQRRVVTAAQSPLPAYAQHIISGVAAHLHDIDQLIADHANVDGLDRIAPVDLATMRVAVWEMLENGDQVPSITAIDQAVSIVKSVSADQSPAFVNAVLDAVRQDLEQPKWSRRRVREEQDSATLAGCDVTQNQPKLPETFTETDVTEADLEELDHILDEY